jgi:signal transduction histidine kinase
MLFLVAVSIAGGMRWRVKSIESKNRELERLVQRRTADLEKRSREIEALYQADEKILRNVTLIQVFQTLVDVSVSLLKADRSVAFAWNDERNKIVPIISHGFRPETLNALVFDEGEGFVGRAMKSRDPVIVQDLKLAVLRGDIQTVIRQEGIQSFAHFPIEVDGKVIAVFNVGYTRPNALNEDNIRLFTALVQRASLSIANMQLFEQTKDLAVMEERNRLARDLHDSAKQKAFAALAQLGTARGMWRTKSEGIQPHLSEAENLVYEVIQELTFLIQEIYPIALQEKGLLTTLREYIYEWENRNDAVVNLTVREEQPLPLETEQAIYRVIQEALANISRHSRAEHVNISLVYNFDSLQVVISDDGCGFDMNQKAKGLGFRSMRERIGSIRGNLQIQSAPGQGTRVIVQVPIKVLAGVERA